MERAPGRTRSRAAARIAAGIRLHDHATSLDWRRGRPPRASIFSGWSWSTRRSRSRRSATSCSRRAILPAVPFARVPVTETWTAKRVLDAGVHGVIFPFVSTPALARQAAHACRYPPAGRRGSGASLATSGWPEPDGYLRLRRSQHHRRRDRRGSVSRSPTSTRLRPRRAWTWSSSARAICRSRSDCAASSTTRASRRRRPTVLAAARRHGKIAGRPAGSTERTRAATSSRDSCSFRRHRSSRSSKPARATF